MSIVNVIRLDDTDKFVIPCVNQMRYAKIEKGVNALCYSINRGYIQFENLDDIQQFLYNIREEDGFKFVGKINRVQIKHTKAIVFRQRLYFTNLSLMLDIIKRTGVNFFITDDFHVSIDNLVNCIRELKYLKYYANILELDVERFLTYACLAQLYKLVKFKGINNISDLKIDDILANRVGLLDRAPFLITDLTDDKKAKIFYDSCLTDKRMYSNNIMSNENFKYGYTSKILNEDKKKIKF